MTRRPARAGSSSDSEKPLRVASACDGLAERSVVDVERDHRRPIERAGLDPGDQVGEPFAGLRLLGRLARGAEGRQGLRAPLLQGPRRLLADHAVGRTEAPDQFLGREVRGQGRRQDEHQAQG